MKIAVLGGGAMGALYGGYLSRKNDVTIVDVNTTLIEKVMRNIFAEIFFQKWTR